MPGHDLATGQVAWSHSFRISLGSSLKSPIGLPLGGSGSLKPDVGHLILSHSLCIMTILLLLHCHASLTFAYCSTASQTWTLAPLIGALWFWFGGFGFGQPCVGHPRVCPLLCRGTILLLLRWHALARFAYPWAAGSSHPQTQLGL